MTDYKFPDFTSFDGSEVPDEIHRDHVELIQAVQTITNDFKNIEGCTTLMGWFKEFDKQGRPLNADPNHTYTSFKIAGKDVYLCRKGWQAVIDYTPVSRIYTDSGPAMINLDLRPDYVKEHDAEVAKG